MKSLLLILALNLFVTGFVWAEEPRKTDTPLVINEFMASNSSYTQDPQGEYDDWLEIFNYGTDAINVAGMYMTDNLSIPIKWRIPDGNPAATTIPAGGFLLIWADDDTADNGLHANFKLDAGGEQVALFESDGSTLIDEVVFGEQTTDLSSGRYPDAYADWFNMSDPTPLLANTIGIAGAPYFSHPAGTFTGSFNLGLATESPTADIYYTLNGSEPHVSERGSSTGTLYTGPIPISRTTWIRARVFASGLAAGPTVSKVYMKLDPDVDDFESNLPIVLIDSFGSNIDYADRNFHPVISVFINTDEVTGKAAITDPANWAGYGGMHIRGASTARYPKRQYRFETWDEYGEDKDASLLGLPSESDWIIHGPWSDRTLMRNYQMYTWSNLVGRYASRTIFVEVFTDYDGNGRIEWDSGNDGSSTDYRGVYVLMEKIKRDNNRVDIEKLEPADNSEPEITGGYLFKKDWGGAGFTTDIYHDHLIYWDPEDYELTSTQKNWIKNYFDEFEQVLSGNMPGVTWNDPCDGYAAYIDVLSFVDHHILVELAKNVDGFVLSTYLFKDRGGKINMGPIWDYNGSLGGADYFCNYNYYGWLYEFSPACTNPCAGEYGTFPKDNPNAYEWYWRLFEDDEFLLKYADRWFELRENLFATDNMLADIDNNVDLLTDNGAPANPVNRNYARWDTLKDNLWPNYLDNGCEPGYSHTYDGYVQWMKDWLTNRLDWMDSAIDQQYGATPPVIRINGGPCNTGTHISSTDMISITSGTGTIWYTLDGNDPRMPGTAPQKNYTELVAENAAKRVLVPTQAIGLKWSGGQSFDDSAWTLCTDSPGGVGYERSSGYEELISLDLEEQMYNQSATCYIRIPFTVSYDGLASYSSLALKIRYDDGFIAYLNGVEVARRNFTGIPAWDSNATSNHPDSSSVIFENIDISEFISLLQSGGNLLAIHSMNVSTTSSDLLVSAKLVAGESIPRDDILSPSAIEYSGPITLTKSTIVKARVLHGSTWSALNEAIFSVSPVAENLRITEIMYNPQDTGNANDPNTEFVELKNIGTEPINLNLVCFTNGIDFTFPDMNLDPDGHVIIIQSRDAFTAKYGTGFNIAGQYSGRLNNTGERIELQDALGQTILDFSFKDSWYHITDGNGFSLNIIDPTSTPNTWEYSEYWQPSSAKGGTPCADDTGHVAAPGDIVINEVLSHSDGNPYGYDWIELHNTTGSSIDISGWFLSDNDSNFKKYEIATGTSLRANGYIVFTEEDHFHNPSDPGCHVEFGLRELGETVYLSSGSGGQLDGGYCTDEDFKAAGADVTFGRYTKSAESGYDVDFVAMNGPTYESENTAGPRVGPLVISEIMYHPASNKYAEYIELHNITDDSVLLYDSARPENTWKLTDEDGTIEYCLPPNTSVPANGYLLLVKNKVAFNEEFVPASGVQIFEWVAGRLSNAGEKVQISKPCEPEPDGFTPYIRVERVNYSNSSHPENFHELPGDPWPAAPNGTGKSLTRIFPDAYGNDPNNWQSADPTPGY